MIDKTFGARGITKSKNTDGDDEDDDDNFQKIIDN